jgi:hypothetical protein
VVGPWLHLVKGCTVGEDPAAQRPADNDLPLEVTRVLTVIWLRPDLYSATQNSNSDLWKTKLLVFFKKSLNAMKGIA